MATVAKPKSARLDMRMTPEQRVEIEYAASLSGLGITQWALQNLLAAARRDVQAATTTRLSSEAFEAFKKSLDEGMPHETEELLERKPVWE